MCSCHSISECCIMFSGVKLSMGSFVLFFSHGVVQFFKSAISGLILPVPFGAALLLSHVSFTL